MTPKKRGEVSLEARQRRDDAELIRMIAKGLSNKEMAQLLIMPVDTVKSRVARALQRRGARDRAHLVAIGYETGLVRVNNRAPASQRPKEEMQ